MKCAQHVKIVNYQINVMVFLQMKVMFAVQEDIATKRDYAHVLLVGMMELIVARQHVIQIVYTGHARVQTNVHVKLDGPHVIVTHQYVFFVLMEFV